MREWAAYRERLFELRAQVRESASALTRDCSPETMARLRKLSGELVRRLREAEPVHLSADEFEWPYAAREEFLSLRELCALEREHVQAASAQAAAAQVEPAPAPPEQSPPEPPPAQTAAASVGPVRDAFRAPLARIEDALAGYGRYAYLLAATMPRPGDPDDPSARAIEALFEELATAPAQLGVERRKRYGVVYVPTRVRPDEDDWRVWATSYDLELAERIRELGCGERCSGRGPYLVVTRRQITTATASSEIFDLGRASPAMVREFVRHFRRLLLQGRQWRDVDPPGYTVLLMRNTLAQLGATITEVAERIGAVRRVIGTVVWSSR